MKYSSNTRLMRLTTIISQLTKQLKKSLKKLNEVSAKMNALEFIEGSCLDWMAVFFFIYTSKVS